jgi:hypothetical protein
MPDYDAGFKIVARNAGRQLSDLAGVHAQEWEPIGDTVQATERLADRAFRARQGRQRFVVYMEAYTRWQASAPWSMLAKSGLLAERERRPVVSVVYILVPRGYRSLNGEFRLEAVGGPTQQIWFREVCLWQQEPQPWWDEAPGLMALYPLCHHRQPRQDALAHAARRITERTADRVVRADLLTTLSIFGRLAYPDLDVLELIGREQMKDSPFYQQIQEEARVEEARAAIGDALEVRFGAEAAAEFQERLQRVEDHEQLRQLHRLAVRCRRLSEFRRTLAAAVPES